MSLNYFQLRELLLWTSLFNSFCSEQSLLVSETSLLCSSSGGTALALGAVLCASLWRDQLSLCVLTMNCAGVSSHALLKQCLGAADLLWMVTGNPCQGLPSDLYTFLVALVEEQMQAVCHLAFFDMWLIWDGTCSDPFLTPWFSQVNAKKWIKSQSGYVFFSFL